MQNKKPLIEVLNETNNEQEENKEQRNQQKNDDNMMVNEDEEKIQNNKQQLQKSKSNKTLLRFEKGIYDNVYNEENDGDEKQFTINQILKKNDQEQIQKQKQKPDFCNLETNSLLSRLQTFLPQFKKDTEDLLQNKDRIQQQQIDISLKEGDSNTEQYSNLENNFRLPSQNQSNNQSQQKPYIQELLLNKMMENEQQQQNEDEMESESEEETSSESEDVEDSDLNNQDQIQQENTDQNSQPKDKVIELDLMCGVFDIKNQMSQEEQEKLKNQLNV